MSKVRNTPEYNAWCSMKARCSNPKGCNFKYYGGRGITYCQQWEKFNNFLADMGNRPPGLTLERIDNDGNYTPQNCVWADRKSQNNNKRNVRWYELDGEKLNLSQWAARLGISMNSLSLRFKRGWTLRRALTEKPWITGRRVWKYKLP